MVILPTVNSWSPPYRAPRSALIFLATEHNGNILLSYTPRYVIKSGPLESEEGWPTMELIIIILGAAPALLLSWAAVRRAEALVIWARRRHPQGPSGGVRTR